ncbi:MAG TPA: 5'/3'-nucleotidase SurE [Bacillota bacterium]|nr:5'/3'-nucleotidase SurE [Bacillota bacterium]HPF42184.1 5'/3'-nucleotidase SurE [Bacillota bacterium]HPJ85689.1 5'/3'-nucleotidase SurE [Bacillota bacterium]HPQ61674.1 5'/3'-nucleotidase SurE [Bacillota bacterium]HRX91829.1 5'/3'-nucleotidase SurE [Candidatus Izemoplasmatales bacterium]
MKILLTNDDGYDAKGIRILYEKLRKYGDVTLVAPAKHMSGASVSRIFWNEAIVTKYKDDIYSVEGTPADAVAFAIHGLKLNPDLVVSGINDGFNIGTDTIYSGTVGACMEALRDGYKCIAFSTDFGYYSPVEAETEAAMDFILAHDLVSSDYILNVNFVSKRFDKSNGIKITDVGYYPFEYTYEKTENGHYRTRRHHLVNEFVEGTDYHAVHNGYISITPLKFGFQTDKGLEELKRKVAQYE